MGERPNGGHIRSAERQVQSVECPAGWTTRRGRTGVCPLFSRPGGLVTLPSVTVRHVNRLSGCGQASAEFRVQRAVRGCSPNEDRAVAWILLGRDPATRTRCPYAHCSQRSAGCCRRDSREQRWVAFMASPMPKGSYGAGVAAGTMGSPGWSVTCGSCTGTPSLQAPMKRCSGVLPSATWQS